MPRKNQKTATAPASHDPITAANYVQRAQAYIRAHDGAGVIVRASLVHDSAPSEVRAAFPDERKFRAWLFYLDVLGVPTRYARHIGYTTVPADYPVVFDPNAPPSPPDDEPEPRAYRPTTDYQPHIGMQFADLQRTIAERASGFHLRRAPQPEPTARLRSLDVRDAKSPEERAAIEAAHLAHLAQLKAESDAMPFAAPQSPASARRDAWPEDDGPPLESPPAASVGPADIPFDE